MVWNAGAGELRAGASRVSITPSSEVFPFTAPHEKPFVGIHDDVYVRSLVIEDGDHHRVAIAVIEATTVPNPQQSVAAVAKEAGVPESNVIVSASHSHNTLMVSYHGGEPGPVHAREFARIQQALVQATREAVANLQPARVAFGRGEAFVNINNGEEAGLPAWNDSKGPSDKTLDVIRVTSIKNEPIAALVNYSTHGEVLFRSATKDGGYEISGDMPGAVSHLLEGDKGLAPVVLFTSAAEGDQVPLFKSLQPAGNLPGTDAGAGAWALLDVQARRLANSVLDVTKNIKAGSATGTIAAAASFISGEER